VPPASVTFTNATLAEEAKAAAAFVASSTLTSLGTFPLLVSTSLSNGTIPDA